MLSSSDSVTSERALLASASRRADELPHQLRQRHLGELELQTARRGAADVEQRADEQRQTIDLTIGFAELRHQELGREVLGLAAPEEAHEVADLELQAGERRAQLVRGDREELVAQLHR